MTNGGLLVASAAARLPLDDSACDHFLLPRRLCLPPASISTSSKSPSAAAAMGAGANLTRDREEQTTVGVELN